MAYTKSVLIFSVIILLGCAAQKEQSSSRVKVGAEVLLQNHLDELDNKRVGLVMNPTARVDGTHMLDTLMARNVNVTALFAPEHGFRGEAGAGEVIENGVDQATGLPVYSLYGQTKKPTREMLREVDVLLFDMQDVGARFYTYNVTLGLVLEAAAESGIPVWVLDRPNPAGGEYVAGWMLEEEFESFVGAYPIPMAHGMTLGELAEMMIGEKWIEFENEPQLKVIPVQGWDRSMKWPETGLEWFPPSPNLPTFEHAFLYLGTVLFEGTNLSEGRGTEDAFLTVGSPDTQLDSVAIKQLNRRYPSVDVKPTTFTPRSMPGMAPSPKHENSKCYGVRLKIVDYDKLDPVSFGVELLDVMLGHTNEAKTTEFIYKLAGSREVDSPNETWKEEIRAFKESRERYLRYK